MRGLPLSLVQEPDRYLVEQSLQSYARFRIGAGANRQYQLDIANARVTPSATLDV
jgi:hypothetical protein